MTNVGSRAIKIYPRVGIFIFTKSFRFSGHDPLKVDISGAVGIRFA
jgi:hypothetical protein